MISRTQKRHFLCASCDAGYELDGNNCKIVTQCKSDVAFVLDCTGSMAGYINEAKNQIRKIVEQIRYVIQISNPFLTFRDINGFFCVSGLTDKF